MVEAFVNSGGNAVLRTAEGNIISSGLGSAYTGIGSYMSNVITVNNLGGVDVSYDVSGTPRVQRTIKTKTSVFTGSSGVITRVSVSRGHSVEFMNSRFFSRTTKQKQKVIISSSGGSVSGGSGGASGESGGGVGASGGSGGASGSGGSVGVSGGGGVSVGGSILGSTASMDAKGNVRSYGSGFGTWTIAGAGPNEARDVQVIGDFGGQFKRLVLNVLFFVGIFFSRTYVLALQCRTNFLFVQQSSKKKSCISFFFHSFLTTPLPFTLLSA